MALPEGILLSRITGTFVGFDGLPAQGSIKFIPMVSRLLYDDVIILREKGEFEAIIKDGELDVEVIATDDPVLEPQGWTYFVFEKFTNRVNDMPYYIEAPSAGIDLSDVVHLQPLVQTTAYVQTVNGQAPDSLGNVEISTSVGSVEWVNVLNKPTMFSPAIHTHTISQVSGLQADLDAKINIDDLPDVAITGSYDDLIDKPVIPDSPDDINAQPAGDYATNSALISGLAGKANTSHTHTVSNVTGLQTALGGKAASSHTHIAEQVSGLATVATSGLYSDLSGAPSQPDLSATPQYVRFNSSWPARPGGSRMVFFIGGDTVANPPSGAVGGDVWIPSS